MSLYLVAIIFLISSCTLFHDNTPAKVDRDGIRKTFHDNNASIQSCYKKVLKKNKTLKGLVRLNFEIGNKGKVIKARINKKTSPLYYKPLNNCLLAQLKTYTFPEPSKNQVVNVTYPLRFGKNKQQNINQLNNR